MLLICKRDELICNLYLSILIADQDYNLIISDASWVLSHRECHRRGDSSTVGNVPVCGL